MISCRYEPVSEAPPPRKKKNRRGSSRQRAALASKSGSTAAEMKSVSRESGDGAGVNNSRQEAPEKQAIGGEERELQGLHKRLANVLVTEATAASEANDTDNLGCDTSTSRV